MDYELGQYKGYEYKKYTYGLYTIDGQSFDTKSGLKRYINIKYFL